MGFNFAEAIKESQTRRFDMIEAIVLGSSGAGKSRLMGTLPGKVLYLYVSSEDHGEFSAKGVEGSNVVSLCIDIAKGEKLKPDEAYSRLVSILTDVDGIKGQGFDSIAIDGASEVEALIRQTTKFSTLCESNSGKHNTFAEPTATITLFRPIISALKNLTRHGIHYAMTCSLDVKAMDDDGSVQEAQVRLQGYQVAENVVQMFRDVLLIGKMERDGIKKHKLQFDSDIGRVSKDAQGRVKKMLNFNPRIAGLEGLPPFMEPDFKELVNLKKAAKKEVKK